MILLSNYSEIAENAALVVIPSYMDGLEFSQMVT
jgi:hypothetical protein